jgi:hypothetical protein
MTYRKITIEAHDSAGKFTEVYNEGEHGSFPIGHPDPARWARELLARFNGSLRPGERKRFMDSVKVEDMGKVDPRISHDWTKTNLVTIMRGNQSYDTARCRVCGITAKRFGVGGYTRDREYRAKMYETCNGAQKALAKKKASTEQP